MPNPSSHFTLLYLIASKGEINTSASLWLYAKNHDSHWVTVAEVHLKEEGGDPSFSLQQELYCQVVLKRELDFGEQLSRNFFCRKFPTTRRKCYLSYIIKG